jgi:hypothetical protein
LAEAFAVVVSKARGETVTVEQARDALADMADETKKALNKHPDIEAAKAQIRLDRAKAAAETSQVSIADLLAGKAPATPAEAEAAPKKANRGKGG